MEKKYPHIKFQRQWKLSEATLYELGQCEAIIRAISNMPLQPSYYDKLYKISLTKGAQATTAIEGNSLSTEEIEQVQNGKSLPPSKEYQGIEIKNILDAFIEIFNEIIIYDKEEMINLNLIKRFNLMVGKDLGDYFQAKPGKLRNNNVHVGPYKAPDYKDVPELMERFCIWLREEFHYEKGQYFKDAIIQAIVAHIYLEWIHPFGDGNGRTGRLLEYYLLLRAGTPDIASFILSNFYNETRSEYYRQLQLSSSTKDLSQFISYAVEGFRDGLILILETIQKSIFDIAWHHYIHNKFTDIKPSKKDVIKRRRELILAMPYDHDLSLKEMVEVNPSIARLYSSLSDRTILRDILFLIELGLIVEGKDKNKYRAHTDILKTKTVLRRVNKKIK